MLRQIGLLIALGSGGLVFSTPDWDRTALHTHREAATDLEIGGKVRGISTGESRFVSREYLLGLPQVQAVIQHSDIVLKPGETGLAVKGIYLDSLRQSFGAEGDAIAAVCADGYTSTFPAIYLREHRPILVLTVDGLVPHDWAVKNKRFDAGTYFVAYEHFIPSFTVLSHSDRPAEPDGVAKIVFDTEDRLYAGIVPNRQAAGNDPTVMDGYRIARQNCYRCHNSGANGGTKAGVPWKKIASLSKKSPERFKTWVHDPQSLEPKSTMPPNKDYDEATLTALQRYFATFAEEGE